jgi:hypothetical protein
MAGEGFELNHNHLIINWMEMHARKVPPNVPAEAKGYQADPSSRMYSSTVSAVLR